MPELKKAFIAIKGKQFPVMYNPTEYQSGMKAVYGGSGDRDNPDQNNQFVRTEYENFTVNLFFDTYEEKKNVSTEMKPITDLILPTIKKRKFKEPPVCTFVWGQFNYRGVIIGLQQKFTMFLSSGIPVRATLALTFQSRLPKKRETELSNRSSSRKFWTVTGGMRLDQIAFQTLDDAGGWREIANFNNIDNPLVFPRGTEKGRPLVIPDLG